MTDDPITYYEWYEDELSEGAGQRMSQPVDVFFCTKATSDIRKALGLACLTRWSMEPGINLHILMPDELVLEDAPDNVDAIGAIEDFDKLKLAWAEFHAASDVYVIADDDWLPGTEPFVELVADGIRNGRNDYPCLHKSYPVQGITFRQKGKAAAAAVCAAGALELGHGYQ